jgi:type II secretory pathway predicted ATPase ExeA
MHQLSLKVNDDIKSRITYSVIMPKLKHEDLEEFVYQQLDKAGLGHNTFSSEALSLIVRSSDGVLRKVRNLCLSCLLEGVRSGKKQIELEHVNRVLRMPHWRNEQDIIVT